MKSHWLPCLGFAIFILVPHLFSSFSCARSMFCLSLFFIPSCVSAYTWGKCWCKLVIHCWGCFLITYVFQKNWFLNVATYYTNYKIYFSLNGKKFLANYLLPVESPHHTSEEEFPFHYLVVCYTRTVWLGSDI